MRRLLKHILALLVYLHQGILTKEIPAGNNGQVIKYQITDGGEGRHHLSIGHVRTRRSTSQSFLFIKSELLKRPTSKKKVTEATKLKEIQDEEENWPSDFNINELDNGDTLLHIAVKNNYSTIVEFLLEKGALVNIRNTFDKTPLDIAQSMVPRNDKIIQLLTTAASVQVPTTATIPKECEMPPMPTKINSTNENVLDLVFKGLDNVILSQQKDVVLILGITGSGKTTLTQKLAGNRNLKAVKVSLVDYVIVDSENKIGRENTVSKTLFPELVFINKTNTTIYDCPGFSDTRSVSHDIASTFYTKKVIDHIDRVKLVFTAAYSNVKAGNDRDKFPTLVSHAVNLVKSVDKFKDAIALVVNKVTPEGGDSDERFKTSIGSYISEVKSEYLQKINNPGLTLEQKLLLQKSVQFLDILLTKDNNTNKYTKIGISRTPTKCGYLHVMELVDYGLKDLQNLYMERIQYVAKSDSDFGYTISEKSKNDINEIVAQINKNISFETNKIVKAAEAQFSISLQKSKNVSAFNEQLVSVRHSLSNKLQGLKSNSQMTPETFASEIKAIFTSLNLTMEDSLFGNIVRLGEFLSFLELVSEKNLTKVSSEWLQSLDAFLLNLIAEKNWYEFIKANVNVSQIIFEVKDSISIVKECIRENLKKQTDLKSIDVNIFNAPNELLTIGRNISDGLNKLKDDIFRISPLKLDSEIFKLLGMKFCENPFSSILKLEQYVSFLETVNGKLLNERAVEWSKPLDEYLLELDELEKWYQFLTDTYNHLATFEVQNDPDITFVGIEIFNEGQNFSYYSKELFYLQAVKNYESIQGIDVSETKYQEFSSILNHCLQYNLTVTCDEENGLIFSGNFVKVSEVKARNEYLECRYRTSISIFALDTVFIDSDILEKGNKVNISILAPKWYIYGSRKIDLDGEAGEAHELNLKRNLSGEGEAGKPGNPGGRSGNFFGVGLDFKNEELLSISGNGGEGGPGQNGASGAEGEKGEDVTVENYANMLNEISWHFDDQIKKSLYLGKKGTAGKKGGDGGSPGFGGDNGTLAIFKLGGDNLKVKLNSVKGKDGVGGKGGMGGLGGHVGNTLEYGSSDDYREYENEDMAEPGANGNDSANSKDQHFPEMALDGDYIKITNEYKYYLLNNMKGPRMYYTQDFIRGLDNDENLKEFTWSIKDSWLGFYNELVKLESLITNCEFRRQYLPYYMSLLHRIEEYAENLSENDNTQPIRKALSYLYISTFSRICNLQKFTGSELVTDIKGYFDFILENEKTVETIEKAQAIVKYRDEYKSEMDRKIEEGLAFINSSILPEIDSINKEIEEQMELLVNQTIELRKSATKENAELEKYKREFEKTLPMRNILSSLKFVSTVLCFLGPKGAAAGAIIGGVSSVSEGFVLDKSKNTRNPLQLPEGVRNVQTGLENFYKMNREKKINQLDAQLEEAKKVLVDAPDELKDLDGKVRSIQSRLKNMTPLVGENRAGNDTNIKGLKDELNKVVLERTERWTKELREKEENKVKKVGKTLRRVDNVIKAVEAVGELYTKIKADQDTLDELGQQIAEAEGKLQNVKAFEQALYDGLWPMISNMQDSMHQVESNLKNQSRIALDVAKWSVQKTLKAIKLVLAEFTKGMPGQERFRHCIENLGEGMTILIDIYDRIQNYQDQKRQADYLADLTSPVSNRIIPTGKMQKVVFDLNQKAQSNLFLERYKRTIHAFKQWVFPFARYYLEEYNLPTNVLTENNHTNLVRVGVEHIKGLKLKMQDYFTQTKEQDKITFKGVFPRPFFVWQNSKWNLSISKLLSGKIVTFKADIRESDRHMDAIKFNTVNIQFKCSNQSRQNELDEKLKNFYVCMTHMGNSYYRYANKYYVIGSSKQKLCHFFAKNVQNHAINNVVFVKLKNGDLILSPYAMWQVQLLKYNGSTFNDLRDFHDKVEIQLLGEGSWVMVTKNLPNLYLEDYYEVDETIPTTDN